MHRSVLILIKMNSSCLEESSSMERRCLLINTYCILIIRIFLVLMLEDENVISFIFCVDFVTLNCSLSSSGNVCSFVCLQEYMYNDLFFYNIKKNSWIKSEIPNPPPPRCSHQVRYAYMCNCAQNCPHFDLMFRLDWTSDQCSGILIFDLTALCLQTGINCTLAKSRVL